MTDLKLILMTGADIPIPELLLILHLPTIKEISLIGEDNFFKVINLLCLDKENIIEDKNALEGFSNFQILMRVMDEAEMDDTKNSLLDLFSILFGKLVSITPNSIILIGEENEITMIDKDNFNILLKILAEVFCVLSIFLGDNIIYNPANDKAKKINEKIMKSREKIAKQKAEKSNKESLLARYLSILSVGISSMSLLDCILLTIYQLFDLMSRFSAKLSWEIDLKVRLAGGDPKSEQKNWMDNIH